MAASPKIEKAPPRLCAAVALGIHIARFAARPAGIPKSKVQESTLDADRRRNWPTAE
jgi:hypothetical protein